jgi:hypothetical protein
MSTGSPADLGPRHGPVLDQRKADLLAFVQRQRRAWHGGVSIGRCWLTAPVIMTGTVHRPMELTVLFNHFDMKEADARRRTPLPSDGKGLDLGSFVSYTPEGLVSDPFGWKGEAL